MDSPVFKTLRICPTTQQGGTQTIQQSIYLTHNNPCGANLLVFQEMGLTKIRYIDLKNYIEDILSSEEMIELFEEIRIAATEYISKPDDNQLYYRYLYTIMQWCKRAMANLPVPEDYYSGYRFRVDVYDGSGTSYYDSFYPILEIIEYYNDLYELGKVDITPAQVKEFRSPLVNIYKVTSGIRSIPFIDALTTKGFSILLSNFIFNQSSAVETEMAVASLLIDSANTRTFGIPKYGFSARQNISQFGGIVYNCAHFIDILTTPDENGHTTLVESIFFRLSLNEDTYNFSAPAPTNLKSANLPTNLKSVNEEQQIPIDVDALMADEEIMGKVVRLINNDMENLESNLKLLRVGKDKEVFAKYYDKLIGRNIQKVEQVVEETENVESEVVEETENLLEQIEALDGETAEQEEE